MTWLYVPSACSTDTADSSSDSDSPGSTYEPWLVLSGTATQRPLSWPGWKRRTWIARLSGMTCAPSTVARGVAEWISSLPVSTANRSRPQDGVTVSMMSDGSGRTLPGSWLTWDRDSCSWRTSPDLFDSEGSTVSAGILPTSGSMRNGVCSPRPPLVHPTSVNGSGSWPTPRGMDSTQGSVDHKAIERGYGATLVNSAKMWGTPVANDAGNSPANHMAQKDRIGDGANRTQPTSLTVQVKMWPTPTSHDSKGEGYDNTNLHNAAVLGLPDPTTSPDGNDGETRADLNPRFVAALMGVPWDWLNPSTSVATDSYRQWLDTHSFNSQNGSR